MSEYERIRQVIDRAERLKSRKWLIVPRSAAEMAAELEVEIAILDRSQPALVDPVRADV